MKFCMIVLIVALLVQGCQTSSLELTPIPIISTVEQTVERSATNNTPEGGLSPTETDTDPASLFFSENVAGFRMIEASPPSEIPEYVTIKPEDTSVFNSTEEFQAYWVCINFCNIFVEELEIGRTYEISAPSILRGRPFSDLEWSDTYILEFNQGTQPNHKVHYVVDVENQLLLNVYPIRPGQ